jgi:hypothetical protein
MVFGLQKFTFKKNFMKRLIRISAAMIAIGCFFAQSTKAQSASATYNFSATVAKFIAVNQVTNNVASLAQTQVDPAVAGSELLAAGFPAQANYKSQLTDNVYANTPFSVTFSGSSLSSSLPILSRQEGNGGIVDRLQTAIFVTTQINGDNANYPGYERHDMTFISDAEGANTGTYTNQSLTFANAPHDGVVRTDFYLAAALPHKTPDFGGLHGIPSRSADAGNYTCQIVATYTAL